MCAELIVEWTVQDSCSVRVKRTTPEPDATATYRPARQPGKSARSVIAMTVAYLGGTGVQRPDVARRAQDLCCAQGGQVEEVDAVGGRADLSGKPGGQRRSREPGDGLRGAGARARAR